MDVSNAVTSREGPPIITQFVNHSRQPPDGNSCNDTPPLANYVGETVSATSTNTSSRLRAVGKSLYYGSNIFQDLRTSEITANNHSNANWKKISAQSPSGNRFQTPETGLVIFGKWLPVAFVIFCFFFLLLIFLIYHTLPLINLDSIKTSSYNQTRALLEMLSVFFFATLFFVSYILSILRSPGQIPDSPEWLINAKDIENHGFIEYLHKETKQGGERRRCKWCLKYKPDRTHHCKVCRRCVLRMDHHCPWIYNCVGWGNHKYFLLSLIYGTISALILTIFMFSTVYNSFKSKKSPFGATLALVIAESLSTLLSLILIAFLCFHLWLVFKGVTTIEYCEKIQVDPFKKYNNLIFSTRIVGAIYLVKKLYYHTKQFYWNQSATKNFYLAFGKNIFLWFLPIDNREGDGICFINENTQLLPYLYHGNSKNMFLDQFQCQVQTESVYAESEVFDDEKLLLSDASDKFKTNFIEDHDE